MNGEPISAAEPQVDSAVTELEDQLRRALADVDNLRKRYAREVARERADERARVVRAWLPVVDSLDRALAHEETEGLRVVRDQAIAVLGELGFSRFEDVGERFDPARHEAVASVDSDAAAGTIVGVVHPGYGSPEFVLRPASVVVSAGRG
jgi:molecular chaperone GrpE